MSAALERLFRYWVKKLRLGDWKLDVQQGTAKEGFDEPTVYAKVTFAAEQREATIFLRRLDKPDQILEDDLVHELLHLVFIQASHTVRGRDDSEQLQLEQAINTTADALVTLRRRSTK